ncbi:MAG: tetratricopeptide repeat protein [bacterium]|nr:tetratricopeptide repeat protein [bacterium]
MQRRVKHLFHAICETSHHSLFYPTHYVVHQRHQPTLLLAVIFIAIAYLILAIMPPSGYTENTELNKIQRLLQSGQTGQALKSVNAYLSNHPNDAQGLFKKGLILAQMNQTDQAIAVFNRLTKDYPELPEPYNNLAVLYSSLGKFDKARDILLTAVKAHPDYATAYENLGDLYVNLAGMAYDRALQIDRRNAKVQTKLAMINDLSSPTPKSHGINVLAPADTAILVRTPTSNTKDVTVSLPQSDESKLVLSTINDWARAWSSKDATTYLSFYATDFVPSPRMSRATWEAARRRRIDKPRTISVSVEQAQINFVDSTDAHVTFVQTYRSDVYRDQVRKKLQLRKQGDQWQIYQEQVITK